MIEVNGVQHMRNSQGHLVPVDRVDPVDKLRDETVRELIDMAKGLSGGLREGRTKMLDAVAAFVSISGEQYGSKVGGEKGNVTLHSYDGSLKVQRAMQDRITFDERLQAARALINECLRDWSEGANANLRAIVDAAWETDKDGNVSTSRILGLRSIKVKDDERWDQAMKALMDSMQVVYSKSFIRVYKKDAYGEFQPIPLDIAKV